MKYLNSLKHPSSIPDEALAVIEIPAGSGQVKYEISEDGILLVDRFIPVSMNYPCNYAFIPHTLGGDGDPIDVLVITREPLTPGCVIKVRIVGMLSMKDEKGEDVKLIAVPSEDIDPYYKDIKSYLSLPSIFLKQIEHFFTHYKDLEESKFVEILGWKNPEEAKNKLREGIDSYNKK